eukprot:GSMAST32.ASY1.ANO1.155.1 assembled CDS
MSTPEKICIVGSGNWGSAIARIVGKNAKQLPTFDETVKMYVYEEKVNGENLSEIINTTHENVKYLPGVKLPSNVADAKAISLIKGIDFDDKGLVLISDLIRKGLDINVSVLMGANVAKEVAKEQFCETTIGSSIPQNGEIFKALFHTDYFRVDLTNDVAGVELCGALKNIVAIGAGFIDGLKLGGNTKAAIIIGLLEMKKFAQKFYSGVSDSTFFESCGVADLITTCYGDIERELLNGQKLQGTLTAKEVYEVLKRTKSTHEFPLFSKIYDISFNGTPVRSIIEL